jgi:elongator complex protein 3
MRASQVNYDAYKQVKGRIKAFEVMHHPTEKIELIIMGGTFLEYPKEFQYKFIKDCFDALNNKISKNLQEAQEMNETAKHRCIALCIETRPDVCSEHIKQMREFGCTRVELGVQMPDDAIYRKIKRGHNVKDVVIATKELKNAGFKVGYHIMPGLPESNLKKDLQLFKKLFSDEKFKPDQIKIYPCQVIKGSELEKLYWEGKYKPYTKEETEKLLTEMLKIVPRYCRVMRIMREIPPEYLVAGTTRIDLRKDIEAELRKNNSKLEEIRYREIGFNPTKPIHPTHPREKDNLILKTTKYKASNGDEYFLEIVNEDDVLFGLLRLRIYNSSSLCSDINEKLLMKNTSGSSIINSKKSRANVNERGKLAIIRELHIYGQALKLGERKLVASQHSGLGKQLMKKAEEIAQDSGCRVLKVISGIGVREYYQKLGYNLENTYMVKEL